MKTKTKKYVQAEVHAGAWKLPKNDVWNVPDASTNEVRFDITTTGYGWNRVTGIAGLAIEPDGKVWGWRRLSKLMDEGYNHSGYVSVGGEHLRAFTSSRLFEREDGSLCDVAILYVCRRQKNA